MSIYVILIFHITTGALLRPDTTVAGSQTRGPCGARQTRATLNLTPWRLGGSICAAATWLPHMFCQTYRILQCLLLASHYDASDERPVLEQHLFRSDELTASPERALTLQKLMLEVRVEAEDRVLETAGEGSWIVCDCSGIDPIVYARLYADREAAREMEDSSAWGRLKTRMARSTIILCEPVAAFLLDDGVRLMPDDMEEWMRVHCEFCDTLQHDGLSYHVVGDRIQDLAHRREFALSKWLDPSQDQAKPAK